MSNPAADDYFGISVSLYEDTALIGAPQYAFGYQNSGVSNSGFVYVFKAPPPPPPPPSPPPSPPPPLLLLAYLTDDIFHDSVAGCLDEAPVDGECTNFGESSGFGTMPNWDVSRVTDMSDTFYAQGKFNADISRWDTSSVTSMQQMFLGNYPSVWIDDFNQDISNWNVSKVTNMRKMFAFCKVFNQDVNKWDVSSVTDMSLMFPTRMRSTCLSTTGTLPKSKPWFPCSTTLDRGRNLPLAGILRAWMTKAR